MKTNKKKFKLLTALRRVGTSALGFLTAAMITLGGGVNVAFADGGSGSSDSGGGVARGGFSYFNLWQDGPTIANPAQGWDDASMDYFQRLIESKTNRSMSTEGDNGAKAYLTLYQEAAREALNDARVRSGRPHARVVGAFGVYGTLFSPYKMYAAMTSQLAKKSDSRVATSSELPDAVGWSTAYMNKDGATSQNWREWLYNYGVKKSGADTSKLLSVVVYAVAEGEPSGASLKLKKSSMNPTVTANNKTYSLAGGEFSVTDPNGKYVGTLKTDASGTTNVIDGLNEGVYTVTETKAPTGFCLDSTPKAVTVKMTSDGSPTVVDFSDDVVMDPINVLVQKAVEDETEAGVAPGDVKDLGGIKFRVDYYDGYYKSESEAKAAGAAKASVVLATDNDGILLFRNATALDGTSWPYKDKSGNNTAPLGTLVITEVGSHVGLLTKGQGQVVQITQNGNSTKSIPQKGWAKQSVSKDAIGPYENPPIRGGITITKADVETHRSEPQGDATLESVKYQIVNDSIAPVVVNGKKYAKGEVVWTGTSKYDAASKTYKVGTGKILTYGTYIVSEVESSEGYLNAKWSQRFSIRTEGQNIEYKSQATKWNENKVIRGGVAISKVDRETRQYTSLGEAHLDGATFDIVNKSKRNVVVGGKEYAPGKVVKTIASKLVDGRYIAQTGERDLPYGTYEIHETNSGKGYLYDSVSKNESYTFEIREDGKIVDLTQPKDAISAADGQAVFDNQVQRGDWNFKKKDENSMERMDKVAFLVTSNTTGESHIIVTDENGTWGSAWNEHTNNTNANDPDSPITNGAVIKDGDGNYVVKDASKLDSEAGTWFTGMSADMTKWNEDGKSYDVNGKTVPVNDALRSFPYDTYTVKELASSTNTGHKLVTFTVTLHKYGKADGEGIDVDYGTVDDKVINIKTELNYGKNGKVVPAAKDTKVSDTVSYDNLSDGKYVLKGELHLVNADGKDEGVVAKAEKEFEIKNGNSTGKQTVDFTIDASDMGGKKLVAFEYLTQNGSEVAKHEDIEDESQTVMIPKIGTTLTGDIEHEADASKKTITLTDTVDYENLEAGKTYTMSGKLMDKATGKALVDKDGKEITASAQFVAKDGKGSTTVVFTFENVDVANKSVVAFESVKEGDVEFATHADIDDKNQTVHFPDIKTEATDKVDGDHVAFAGEKQTIVDKVDMHNLTVGKKYKVSGTLHIQAKDADGNTVDGGVLKDGDKEVVAEKEFTADKTDMSVNLEFTFDASQLAGKTVVAFETLSRDGVPLGLHADITDKSQSVSFPKIGTTLEDANGSHEVSVTEKTDDKKDAESDAKADDKADTGLTAEVKKADKADKKDAESDAKADAKIDEKSEAKAEDEGVAKSKTTSSVVDGTKVTLTDHVAYENLIPGTEYTVEGKLHVQNVDKDGKVTDGGVLKVDGKKVTAQAKFKAEKESGVVDVVFEFDAKGLTGKSVVAFEDLKKGDKIVATHADINDESQTVRFVEIGTVAVDAETNSKAVTDSLGATQKITINDTVNYTNLKPGKPYTVEGTLHLQKTDKDGKVTDGGVVKDKEGKEVTASASFTPEKANGSTVVKFEFEVAAGALDGATLVTFEDLKNGDNIIATHSDINDESQSVHKLKLGTTLTGADKKAKDIKIANKVDVVDTVAFENLAVGQEYVIKGKLVDKTGAALKGADGKEVTAESTFKPDKANGTAEMKFTLDTSKMKDGDKVVAYEYVYTKDGKLVGHHADLKDANQTITVKKDSDTPTSHVDLETGVDNFGRIAAIAMGILALAAAAAYEYRRRN